MKKTIPFIMVLALILSALTLPAQNSPALSPTPTWTPGPAWRLTPEQRAERQQKVQAFLADLRAKRDNGTINAHEKAQLDRMEQAGGLGVNGVPRGGGPRAELGPRNGTGPRAQMGICPLVNDPVLASPRARGGGFGLGRYGGRGRGPGGGFGLRNGTGPCAQDGTCPLLNPPAK